MVCAWIAAETPAPCGLAVHDGRGRLPSSAVVPAILQVAALSTSGGAIELANSRVGISVRSA
jgi:hypothetical protein